MHRVEPRTGRSYWHHIDCRCGDLSWHSHIASIAKSASRKLGLLFRSRLHPWTTSDPLQVPGSSYSWILFPHLGRCHKDNIEASWFSSEKSSVPDKHSLTGTLQSLSHRSALATFSIFYRCYHGQCSAELSTLIPPDVWSQRTKRSTDWAL